ncbi:MAG TPA: glycosyltransferase [Fimbriimonadaceae bacterium]|nr:glycosyltransferase [Fimbriimonadaceae bacterium]
MEEPIEDVDDGGSAWMETFVPQSNIEVAVPHIPRISDPDEYGRLMRRLTRQILEKAGATSAFDSPLLWYYTPIDSEWSLGHFESSGIIYDCMDELSAFRGARPELVEAEQRLFEWADIVFTGGYELWLRKKAFHPNVHFFGCGVESNHFGQALLDDTAIPEDVASLKKPILGWFGVIDERVDYSLLDRLAEARPDWSIVMVGPTVKVDPSELPRRENILWLGNRDYRSLPNYCKAFDICMMPFALNEATVYINPTKALEYMATGRPIIATPVRDVVRQYSDIVYIEAEAEGFIRRAEQILRDPDEARVRRGIEKAAASSWDNTVEKMRNLIFEAVAGRG